MLARLPEHWQLTTYSLRSPNCVPIATAFATAYRLKDGLPAANISKTVLNTMSNGFQGAGGVDLPLPLHPHCTSGVYCSGSLYRWLYQGASLARLWPTGG